MKVRIIKPCHVEYAAKKIGDVADVPDSLGAQLKAVGYAIDAGSELETATEPEAETAVSQDDSPRRANRRFRG